MDDECEEYAMLPVDFSQKRNQLWIFIPTSHIRPVFLSLFDLISGCISYSMNICSPLFTAGGCRFNKYSRALDQIILIESKHGQKLEAAAHIRNIRTNRRIILKKYSTKLNVFEFPNKINDILLMTFGILLVWLWYFSRWRH